MEIAKETLAEHGVKTRPFASCCAEYAKHREAYFDMLNAARDIVPDVRNEELRRG